MRADRLLSELLLLQAHRTMTAREMSRRLEVSARTIHRDMEALSAAGIPVIAERGIGGGWGLAGNYQTKLTGMNPPEVQSLLLSKPDKLLRDLGLDKAADAAVVKLLAALPATARRDAEFVRERFYVDVTGWRQMEEAVANLPVVQEALWQSRQLSIDYDGYGCSSQRVVSPLGLVAKGSVWYMVAAHGGERRTYRVSRIRSARMLDQAADRPADFKLFEYWKKSAEEFRAKLPSYFCTIRASAKAMQWIEAPNRKRLIVERKSPEVRLRFDVEEEALQFVLGLGAEVEVMEPAGLRKKVVQAAKEIVAFYTQ
jgi:predicted DNA-binding transcriptional regulator YafY